MDRAMKRFMQLFIVTTRIFPTQRISPLLYLRRSCMEVNRTTVKIFIGTLNVIIRA